MLPVARRLPQNADPHTLMFVKHPPAGLQMVQVLKKGQRYLVLDGCAVLEIGLDLLALRREFGGLAPTGIAHGRQRFIGDL